MIPSDLKTRDLVYLPYSLFCDLVSIAKTKGGCVIVCRNVDDEKMLGIAAYIFHEGDVDLERRITRYETITLSDPIDADRFYAEFRPEMDWRKVPREQIYYFIVHHEIGHALLDHRSKKICSANGTVDEEKTKLLNLAREMRADRYAWKSVFPSQPLPRREGCESTVERLETFMRDHKDLFPGARTPKPLPW